MSFGELFVLQEGHIHSFESIESEDNFEINLLLSIFLFFN